MIEYINCAPPADAGRARRALRPSRLPGMAPDVRFPMPASLPPPRRPRRHPLLAPLRLAFRGVCALVILLDDLVRPLYAPLVRRIAALRLVRLFEAWVGGLSPYWVLVLIGVPYVVVEPLKFLALLQIADGRVKTGTFVFLLANLVSFVLIERIFSAGRARLMTLRPMAWLIETVASVRRSLSAYLRIDALRARVRVLWRWARLRLR